MENVEFIIKILFNFDYDYRDQISRTYNYEQS